MKLADGPALVAHLIPTQAALGLVRVDPVPYANQRGLRVLGSGVEMARLNIDGALATADHMSDSGRHGYTQFFRNGFLESVCVLHRRAPGDSRAILPGRPQGSAVRATTTPRASGLHSDSARDWSRAGRLRESAALAAEHICPYTPTVRIEWDPGKAQANLRTHGVGFPEAATVLQDDQALTREEPDAIGEQRFVTLGMSATGLLLVVVFTHREPDIYRLISSWKANKPQRKQYEKARR